MLKVFVVVLVLIAFVSFLLYVMPVRIKFKTIRKDENDLIVVKVKTLYGIINVKLEVPLLDIVFINNKPALKYKAELESNKTSKLWKKVSKIFSIDDINNLKKYFHHDPVLLHRLKDYWLKRFFVYDFTFILKYGLSDAALAAILYGTAWTIIGALVSVAQNNLNFTIKNIVITPYFDRETFSIEFSCIIKFKFGDIINTGIIVLRRRAQRRRIKHGLNEKLNAS